MEEHAFIVDEKTQGIRLDKFLVLAMPKESSRAYIQTLIKSACVLIDGKVRRAHHIVKVRERIEVKVPSVEPSEIRSEAIPLNIVYEDDDLLVVNKPTGMVVHPAPGNWSGTLVNALLGHSKGLSNGGDAARPGIVHRLDKETSGLLVVAKDDAAHRDLAKQFTAHSINRRYIALVKGAVQLDNGIIELPIGRDRRDRKKMGVVFANSKHAVTRYKVLRRFVDSTLLELRLETGRTHQIRVHLAYIGHPIIGDEKYGGKMGCVPNFGRLALHAKTIGFVHPRSRKLMEFDSELPVDMKEAIERCSHGKDD